MKIFEVKFAIVAKNVAVSKCTYTYTKEHFATKGGRKR